jgi:acyl-CoA synthetase (AMP-forming)/AMP-acid ligase II
METPRLPRIGDYLDHFAAVQPDTVLVKQGTTAVTYREAKERVDRLAAALLARGLRRGDRVAVYGHPHSEGLLVFLACARVGAIFTGLAPKQQVDELAYICTRAEPRFLFVVGALAADQLEKVAALGSRLAREAKIGRVETIRCGADAPPGCLSSEQFEAAAIDREELAVAAAAVAALDPAAMVFTSGSSGAPKAALLVHGPMMRSYSVQAEHWYGRRPVGVADLPINHLGFVADNCMTLMVAGGTINVLERWTPEGVLELLEAERFTFWWTQTTMLLLATRSPRWARTDFGSLERIAFGGAPVNPSMLEALAATGAALSTGYGMTEVHGNITYTDNDAPVEALLHTVGRPHHEFEVRIVDEEGEFCPAGAVGEIVARTDTLFGGYRDRAGAIDPGRDEEGWYHTKDTAFEREDGNFVLVGRKDHMFKSGGFNVYPREVERVLESHPDVSIAVVVDVPDPTWARVGHAYVVPEHDRDLAAEDLDRFAREHLANYKVPKRFHLREELPMLISGKVDSRALQRESEALVEG